MSPDVSGVPGSKTRSPFGVLARGEQLGAVVARPLQPQLRRAAAPVDLDAVQAVVAAGVAGEVGQRARIGRRRRRRDVDRELAARNRDVLERATARASADGLPDTAASFTWPRSSVRAHVSDEPSASSRMPGSSTAVMWRSQVSRYATRRVDPRPPGSSPPSGTVGGGLSHGKPAAVGEAGGRELAAAAGVGDEPVDVVATGRDPEGGLVARRLVLLEQEQPDLVAGGELRSPAG